MMKKGTSLKDFANAFEQNDEDDDSQHDIFQHNQGEEFTRRERLQNYFKESSLFIFHRTHKIRKLCLQLVEPPEVMARLTELESIPGGLE